MEATDEMLVRRLARQGDHEAFRTLLSRYADMVYSTSLRILRDNAQAADVTQETFFQMFKAAARIEGSPGGWLHQVATRRAIDLIRQNSSRRRREDAYARSLTAPGSSWSEVAPLVDAALERLPDEYRDLLIEHFLQRKSMTQIAAARAISQPTISRRVAEGLEMLRQGLRQDGVVLGVVPLQVLLLHSAEAAPEVVLKGLGKLTLAQAIAGQAASSSLAGGTIAAVIAAAAAVVALVWHFSPPVREVKAPIPVASLPEVKPTLTPPAAQPISGIAATTREVRALPTDAPLVTKPAVPLVRSAPIFIWKTNAVSQAASNAPSPDPVTTPLNPQSSPKTGIAGTRNLPPSLVTSWAPPPRPVPPRAVAPDTSGFLAPEILRSRTNQAGLRTPPLNRGVRRTAVLGSGSSRGSQSPPPGKR